MPTKQKEEKKMIDQLGNEFSLDFKDVSFASTNSGQILIPTGMSLSEANWWIQLKQRDEETEVAINERIEGYPIDVAYALQLAVMDIFGIRELRNTPGFFGETPPTFQSIAINSGGDTVEIFLGRFAIPGAEGYLETSRDFNDALWVRGKIRQKSVPVLRKLIHRTKEMLRTTSLYKGKAFRVWMEEHTEGFETKVTMANPEFIDVNFLPAQLMLNRNTTKLLEATLWAPVTRSEQTRHYGKNLKRTILLEGPYGTGKSLTALVTAAMSSRFGWTFIYLNDVADLKRVYPFANRYAPSIIFAEDIDTIAQRGNEGIEMLNNVLDGVDTKDRDVILVLTSNHVDKLPKSLLRPGRFDTIVHYYLPDRDTAARLVRQYGGSDIDTTNFDDRIVGDKHGRGEVSKISPTLTTPAICFAGVFFCPVPK